MESAVPPAPQPLVLIVEDDLATRMLYRECLRQAGFRTADAHNGRQALALAHERHPDIVVTDLGVPGMDGFEFCCAFQETIGAGAIPILAITGRGEYLDEPERFRRAGIAQVLLKPCPPEVIVEALRRLLEAAVPTSVAR